MAEEKAQTPAQAPQEAPKGPFVHQLKLYLEGGQVFTINEVADTMKAPKNIVAFINAWRQHSDVWHSPNNDPRFGVRIRSVSLYEYRVGTPSGASVQGDVPAENK